MLIGKRPQGGGRPAHWLTQKVLRGKIFNGHIAGPCIGVEVHCGVQTKPCLKCYVDPKADCVGCNHRLRRDWLGYQPVYRWIDGKPVVVTIHIDQQDRVERFVHGDHVLIGREDQDNAGIWIRKDKGPAFESTLPARQTNADISDWLPTLWRLCGIITGAMLRNGADVPGVIIGEGAAMDPNAKRGVVTDRAWAEAPAELRAMALENNARLEREKQLRRNGASTLNGDGEHDK